MKKFIEDNKQNMLNDLAALVSYNSVLSDDAEPFGLENRRVLDKALEMMEGIGLKTCNLDYYCGYGEIGEGKQTVGIISHLDVVPAGEGWDSDPFVLREEDGYVYGRGATDNKSAFVSCLYALKYLIESGYHFKKRFRLIGGCNEETGSACIKHYVEKEGHIDMGFTPDGSFPGIYGEKGIINGELIGHKTNIINITAADASNIIPKSCICEVEKDSFDIKVFETFLNEHNISYEIDKNKTWKLTTYGTSTHAMSPERGVNALTYLLEALYQAGFKDSFIDFFHRYFALEYHGESVGCGVMKDDLTDTSLCLTMASIKEDGIHLTVDMRYPVKSDLKTARSVMAKLYDADNEFVEKRAAEPLYFDVETPFVKALYQAYVNVTGNKDARLEVMGGGTYAKSIHNCIAFGNGFHTGGSHVHGANERLLLEHFYLETEIFIEAIKNLNEV